MKKFSHPLIFHSFKFALIWLSSTEWKAGPAGCVLECLVVLLTGGNYGDKGTGACRYVGQGITISESQDVSSIPVLPILDGSVLGRSRLRPLASIKMLRTDLEVGSSKDARDKDPVVTGCTIETMGWAYNIGNLEPLGSSPPASTKIVCGILTLRNPTHALSFEIDLLVKLASLINIRIASVYRSQRRTVPALLTRTKIVVFAGQICYSSSQTSTASSLNSTAMPAVSHMFSLFFLLSIFLGGMCFPLDRRDKTNNYRSVPISIRTMKMQDGSKESAICFGTQYFLTAIKDPENPNQFKGSSVQKKPNISIKQYTVATADFGYKTTEQFKSAIEYLGGHSASSSLLWMHETLTKMVEGKYIREIPKAWTTALEQQGFNENANWLGNTGAGSSNGEAVRNPGGKQAGNGGGGQEVEGSRESTTQS